MSPAAATATRREGAARVGLARAPARAPYRAPARRPDLEIVRRPRPRAVAIPRGRRRATILAVFTGLVLLSLVVFHAMVAQSQIGLERIEQRTARAQRAYETARLEYARLAAPSRILKRAAELGLVPPAAPPIAVGISAPAAPRESSEATTGLSAEVEPRRDPAP